MLNRLTKALRVLDLLQHRRSVSREALIRETGATERTVYRLLRLLSEADIPVYYDQDTQGYRLNSPSTPAPIELTLQELTLAIFALDLLAEVVGPAYTAVLEAARERLIRCHPFDLDYIFYGQGRTSAIEGLGGIDAALNSALVSAAIETGSGIEVDVDGQDGMLRRVSIAVPSLVYKSPEWLIADKSSSESIALSSVRAVRIVSDVPAQQEVIDMTVV